MAAPRKAEAPRWATSLVGALVAAVLVASCSSTIGSGRVLTESREVRGFSRVELSGIGDVRVRQGDSESLSITAETNLLPLLTSDVSDGTLRLETRSGAVLRPTQPITYDVTMKDLTGVAVSGSGSVAATAVRTPRLEVEISGSGTVSVDGAVETQDVSVSGSGRYEGGRLASTTASVQLSGSGSADLAVRERLRAEVSGSGTVTYSGDPRVTQDISGSGSLRKR
ncbi:MAG TPA: head GIN domain-containing protein [Intrasporangium sp.]|uniref:head GIN domain-containing protein n=1 Tax=Intrasporangium sp. TaxID=1925024 RepID=UPI002D7974D3|nr:head GIN domain-containing protein [Intrasporangium sp.]HET7399649.1 head GIN domain-containing protein [Intrasporangium sp.]